MLLYLLGFGMAIYSAYVLNKIMKVKARLSLWSKCPITNCRFFKNAINVIEKTKAFVYGAGK
jgi:ferrous iron transport protein B